MVWYLTLQKRASVVEHAVGQGTALQAGRPWVQFPMLSLEFFIETNLRPHYGPGVDIASNRNKYQQYFLGGGRGVKVAGA